MNKILEGIQNLKGPEQEKFEELLKEAPLDRGLDSGEFYKTKTKGISTKVYCFVDFTEEQWEQL